MANALSPTMTVHDFQNGYWYLDQLKNVAECIAIPAAKKLRKEELEKAIVAFLRTGHLARIHRSLAADRIVPMIERLLMDSRTVGKAQDALDDI